MEMENKIQSKEVDEAAEKAARILMEYDKLADNPDAELLKSTVARQLEGDGFLTLTMFACLDWKPRQLGSDNPERFIVDEVRNMDLFTPRMPKLVKIQKRLAGAGIDSELVVAMGDTDVQDYLEQILETGGIDLDSDLILERQKRYIESFEARLKQSAYGRTSLVLWSDVQAEYEGRDFTIPQELIEQVADTTEQILNEGENWKNLKIRSRRETLLLAARNKIKMYARQGFMIEEFTDGIFLQSETPWEEKTAMLKQGGARFAAIYPWIRREELVE